MHITVTVDEAREIAQATAQYPPSLTSVTADGDDIRFVIDLRLLPDAPAPIKLAARLVPLVRGSVHLIDFSAGILVIGVHATAGGLPAEKLLSLAESAIADALAKRGLPEGSVRVMSGGRVAVDVQLLMEAFLGDLLPESRITDFSLVDGVFRVEAKL